jgi:glutamine amidotransferase
MVGIVDYGIGNLRSVINACERVNQETFLVQDPAALKQASAIILPGVAAFAQGMKNLEERGFVEPLRQAALQDKKPFLGLCLGMQLLADWGSEGEGRAGLGLIPGTVERFADGALRVPHIGWNSIEVNRAASSELPLRDGVDFYFVHSYYFKTKHDADVLAWTDYGVRFASIVGRDNIVGCQFHPEKSHPAGTELLTRFFKALR